MLSLISRASQTTIAVLLLSLPGLAGPTQATEPEIVYYPQAGYPPELLTPTDDRVYFRAQHLTPQGWPDGYDIWSTDGTGIGTFRDATPSDLADVDFHHAAAVGSKLYAIGTHPVHGEGLFTIEGRHIVEPVRFLVPPDGTWMRNLIYVETAFGRGTLYFLTKADRGLQLWRFDPASEPATAFPVLVIRWPLCDGLDPVELRPWGTDLAVFSREDIDGDCATTDDVAEFLWRSDGSANGTRRLAQTRFLERSPYYGPVTTVGDRLFFFGESTELVAHPLGDLWTSDGTADGTVKISDLHADLDETTGYSLATTSTHVYFEGLSEGSCSRVWRSDGTAEGTELASELCLAHDRPVISTLGDIVFAAFEVPSGDTTDTVLYRLLGQPLRAEVVTPDVEPLQGFSKELAGRLYFRGRWDAPGSDLFSTDGTAEGTRLEADFDVNNQTDTIDAVVVGDRLVWRVEGQRFGLYAFGLSCLASSETLCVGGDRFQIRSAWHHTPAGGPRIADQATTVDLTRDTAGFTFFDEANVEMAIKVLDGRVFNDRWWVFLASLSSLGFDIDIVDTDTGQHRVYSNLDGQFASFADIEAFADSAVATSSSQALVMPPSDGVRRTMAVPLVFSEDTAETTGPCVPAADILCLDHEEGDGRFRLSVDWRAFDDAAGRGIARDLTADTGGFWFFDQNNVELLVKILDARAINGHFWVFLGSLSSVEFTLVVEDTTTGGRAVYTNPLGAFASFGDVEALPDFP